MYYDLLKKRAFAESEVNRLTAELRGHKESVKDTVLGKDASQQALVEEFIQARQDEVTEAQELVAELSQRLAKLTDPSTLPNLSEAEVKYHQAKLKTAEAIKAVKQGKLSDSAIKVKIVDIENILFTLPKEKETVVEFELYKGTELSAKQELRLAEMHKNHTRGLRAAAKNSKTSRNGITHNVAIPIIEEVYENKDGTTRTTQKVFFNNDPLSMAEARNLGYDIEVPAKYRGEGSKRNPSIKVSADGFVTDVYHPLRLKWVKSPGDLLQFGQDTPYVPREIRHSARSKYVGALPPVRFDDVPRLGNTAANVEADAVQSVVDKAAPDESGPDGAYLIDAANFFDGVIGGNRRATPSQGKVKRARVEAQEEYGPKIEQLRGQIKALKEITRNETLSTEVVVPGNLAFDPASLDGESEGLTVNEAGLDELITRAEEELSEATAANVEADAVQSVVDKDAIEAANARLESATSEYTNILEEMNAHENAPTPKGKVAQEKHREKGIALEEKLGTPTKQGTALKEINDATAELALAEKNAEDRIAGDTSELEARLEGLRSIRDTMQQARESLIDPSTGEQVAPANLDELLRDLASQLESTVAVAREKVKQAESEVEEETEEVVQTGVYQSPEITDLLGLVERAGGSPEDARTVALLMYKQEIREFGLALQLLEQNNGGRPIKKKGGKVVPAKPTDPVKWFGKFLERLPSDSRSEIMAYIRSRHTTKVERPITLEQAVAFFEETNGLLNSTITGVTKSLRNWAKGNGKINPDKLTMKQLASFATTIDEPEVRGALTQHLDAEAKVDVDDDFYIKNYVDALLQDIAPDPAIKSTSRWVYTPGGEAKPPRFLNVIDSVKRRYADAARNRNVPTFRQVDAPVGDTTVLEVDQELISAIQAQWEGRTEESLGSELAASEFYINTLRSLEQSPAASTALRALAEELGSIEDVESQPLSAVWMATHDIIFRDPQRFDLLSPELQVVVRSIYRSGLRSDTDFGTAEDIQDTIDDNALRHSSRLAKAGIEVAPEERLNPPSLSSDDTRKLAQWYLENSPSSGTKAGSTLFPQHAQVLKLITKALDSDSHKGWPTVSFLSKPNAAYAQYTGAYSSEARALYLNLSKPDPYHAETFLRGLLQHTISSINTSTEGGQKAYAGLLDLAGDIANTFPGDVGFVSSDLSSDVPARLDTVRFAMNDPVAFGTLSRKNPSFVSRLTDAMAKLLKVKGTNVTPRGTSPDVEEEGAGSKVGVRGLSRKGLEEVVEKFGDDAQGMAKWLANNAVDPTTRLILDRITPYLSDWNIIIAKEGTGEKYPAPIARGKARGLAHAEANKPGGTVYLRGHAASVTGISAEVITHELIHAATMHQMRTAMLVANKGTDLQKAWLELRDVLNLVNKERRKAGKEGESAYDILNRIGGPNRLDSDELIAWGLTNKKFQDFLMTVEVEGGQTAFSAFVDAVRRVLGIPRAEKNALTEVIRLTDDIIKADIKGLPRQWGESKATFTPRGTASPDSGSVAKRRLGDLLKAKPGQVWGGEPKTSRHTPSSKGTTERSIDVLNRLAPAGVKVEVSSDHTQPAWVTTSSPDKVFVNLESIDSFIGNLSPEGKEQVLRALLNHELAHLASIQALTDQDRAEILAEMTDADFLAAQARVPDGTGHLELAEEFLRMKVEQATYGVDSDTFIYSVLNYGTGLRGKVIRFLQNFLSKLRSLFQTRPSIRTAVHIERVSDALAGIERGGFDLRPVPSADVEGHLRSLEDLEEGTERTFFSVPIHSTDPSVESRLGAWRRRSKMSKEVNQINNQIRFKKTAIGVMLQDIHKKIRRAAGKRGTVVISADVNAALGSTDPYLTEKQEGELSALREADVAAGLDPDTVKANNIARIRAAQRGAILAKEKTQQEAIARLSRVDPELANDLVKFREELTEMSRDVGAIHDGGSLKGVFDDRGNVHLIRSYEFFNSRAFQDAAKAAQDDKGIPGYEGVPFNSYRTQAIGEIQDQHLRKYGKKISGKRARQILMGMLNEWSQLRPEQFSVNTLLKSSSLFEERQNLPEGIRSLLGQRSNLDSSMDTALKLGSYLAKHEAADSTRKLLVGNKWAFESPDAIPGVALTPLWSPLQSDGDYAALHGLYARPEDTKIIEETLSGILSTTGPESDTLAKNMSQFTKRVFGTSLTMKTLFQIGFYTRNEGNMSFVMLPMQGIWGGALGFMGASGKGRAAGGVALGGVGIGRLVEGKEAYTLELIRHGIIKDEVTAGLIRDIHGRKNSLGTDVQKDLDEFAGGGKPKGWLKKSIARVLKSQGVAEGSIESILSGAAGYDKLVSAMAKLNEAIDAKGKILMYEYELDVLKKARDDSSFTGSDEDLKALAADKVRKTLPGHSQVYKPIKSLTRSNLGLLIAPFARFKGETVRTVINTLPLAWSEWKMGVKYGSATLKKRAMNRAISFGLVFAFWEQAFAYLVSKLFDGANDREEEDGGFIELRGEVGKTLRSGLPKWAQGHTIFARRNSDGTITTYDLTYYTHLSLIKDPIKVFMDRANTDGLDEGVKAFTRTLGHDLIGEGIGPGALREILSNSNDYGREIYLETDDAGVVAQKMVSHYLTNALEPGIVRKGRQLAISLSDRKDEAVNGDRYYDATNLLLGEATGVKPFEYRETELMKRSARHTKRQLDLAQQYLSVLNSPSFKEGEELKEGIRDYTDAYVDLWKQHRRNGAAWADFTGDESSYDEYARLMVVGGQSKDRTRKAMYGGVLDRKQRSRKGLENMYRAGDTDGAEGGETRVQNAVDGFLEQPRFHDLTD